MTTRTWKRREFLTLSGLTVAGVAGVSGVAGVAGCERTGNGGGTEGQSTLDRITEAGRVRVGIANEQPYGFRRDGEITGEAPEVARAVFDALGVGTLEGVLVNSFDALIPGLVSEQYDIIAAGMFITPDRCAEIAFTNPDYCGTTAFLVREGNPLGLQRFEDIAQNSSVRLGVLSGAVERGYAEGNGVPAGQISTFPDQNAAFQGMIAERVDAVALTSISLRWTLQQQFSDRPLEVTESFIPVVDGEEQIGCGGYGVREEDTELREAFNSELSTLQENDEVLPLIEQFGFTEVEVSRALDYTADELCGDS